MKNTSNVFPRHMNRVYKLIVKHELLCVFIVFFVTYLTNFRLIGSGDTIPASILPFNILENHNLYLDDYATYYKNICFTYFLAEGRGHFISAYPIVTPILITPLYAILYIIMKIIDYPIDIFNPGFRLIIMLMEKTSASLIASASSVFIFLTVKELTNHKNAIVSVIIFAIATNTWAISSQGLWQHGTVELLLSMMIYLIIINEKNKNMRYIFYLGFLSGLFIFNRPSESILLLPILYYIFKLNQKSVLLYYFCFMMLSSAPFILYNFYFFDNLFGGYSSLLSLFTFNSQIAIRFIGLLISPSRGLFIYTPILLLSLFGFLKIRKISNENIKLVLFIFAPSIILQILLYSCFKVWWAGWSYGPRFLTGMLPILIIFLSLYLEEHIDFNRLNIKKALSISLIFILLLISIFVQIVGVFYYPSGSWDADPNIDLHPERLWDWEDTQIMRSFHAGPIIPNPLANLNMIWTSKNINDIINDGILLDGAWHGLEFWNEIPTRWMKNNASIKIYSSTEKEGTINFNIQSFYKPRTLQAYVNDELAHQSTISSPQQISLKLHLKKGDNIIKFYTPDGCQRPTDIPELNNRDTRCLSFAFQNITLT